MEVIHIHLYVCKRDSEECGMYEIISLDQNDCKNDKLPVTLKAVMSL